MAILYGLTLHLSGLSISKGDKVMIAFSPVLQERKFNINFNSLVISNRIH